jgi:hypothetical protein
MSGSDCNRRWTRRPRSRAAVAWGSLRATNSDRTGRNAASASPIADDGVIRRRPSGGGGAGASAHAGNSAFLSSAAGAAATARPARSAARHSNTSAPSAATVGVSSGASASLTSLCQRLSSVRGCLDDPAYDQPVAGARHADVEETPVLLLGARPPALDDAADTLRHVPDRAHPDKGTGIVGVVLVAERQEARIVGAGGVRRGAVVDQKDDVRLQTLGAVDGHDADLVAERVGVALDLGVAGKEPGKEAFQRRAHWRAHRQAPGQGTRRARPPPRSQGDDRTPADRHPAPRMPAKKACGLAPVGLGAPAVDQRLRPREILARRGPLPQASQSEPSRPCASS